MTPAQLRAIIDSMGISQREMARRMNVNERTMRKWLAGGRDMGGPAVRRAIRIRAAALGTDPARSPLDGPAISII
jgi:DNA-binding transcriptional regulator YiaG